MYVSLSLSLYIYIYMCIKIYIYIYICIYLHTSVYNYTCINEYLRFREGDVLNASRILSFICERVQKTFLVEQLWPKWPKFA